MSSLKEIVQSTQGETREVLENLVHSLADSTKEITRLEQRIKYMAYDNRLLKKRLFGASSEKKADDLYNQSDLGLFDDFEICASQVEPEELELPELEDVPAPKKPAGRKPLPKNLPRKTVEHDLSDEEKQCGCGSEMECIGSQKSEELHFQPAKLTVIEHHRKKYACPPCCNANKKDPSIPASLKTATKPKQLIPKSIASNSLLAQIIISKFCDHLPLYRQETIFKRLSINLPRQTMSQWMLKVGEAIIPLVNLLQETILDYDISYADETTLQVLKEPGRRPQTKSYMWCFIGGPPDQRVIIYQYHASRGGDVANDFYEGYRGALSADGYGGYSKLFKSDDIVGINCMAHVRRKFIEALPNGKEKGVSGQIVKLLRVIYKIEAALKNAGADEATVYKVRQEKAKPLLEKLKTYLDEKSKTVLPKSKVGEAISYTLKRWHYLTTYLEDGRYEIDNNRAERAIKPFVMVCRGTE